MAQNFTYLMFLCAASMLLIIGGILLTKFPILLQTIMILLGLISGIICFIRLIKLLITNNKEQNAPFK